MKARTLLALAVCFAFLAALGHPWSAPASAQKGMGLVIVVAPGFPASDIKLTLLRRAFEGAPAEVNGKRLIAINHPTSAPTRHAFDRAVLGLAPEAVGRFWVDRRIRDEGAPPKTVPSPELAVRIAASLPMSITYVPPELANSSVKVVSVDGKALGQAGYPLAQ